MSTHWFAIGAAPGTGRGLLTAAAHVGGIS
jgi:hypothetical protein